MAKTILFVDKDLSFVEKLRQKYLAAGYNVLCAGGHADAKTIYDSVRPDAVVTEVILERQDGGFSLAWEVKKKYPDVPVIIVSDVAWQTGLHFDLDSPESRSWIMADAFLDKPIRTEELHTILQNLLKAAKAA
jgi:Response regulator containing CheY-like receiver, AAA-type ATPase, and DNA-binding domains